MPAWLSGPFWGAWLPAGALVPALLLAMLVDLLFGEPAARWHPVVWMGRYLARCGRHLAPLDGAGRGAGRAGALHSVPEWPRFCGGAACWLLGAGAVGMAAWWLQNMLVAWPAPVAAVLLGLMLKPLLAWRMLRDEVRAVEAALGESLDAGRARLSWLVSRDVDGLGADQVRESAIESLAENLNDSVVAPIFWFAVLGLPGAAVYRFANTADAMWGYHGVRDGRVWEWAGKWAARADDVLSWLPARLTAGLLWALTARSRRGSVCTLGTEAALTPSPNSGWPMAAMALGLGVRLSKPGAYALNAHGRAPVPGDTRTALALCRKAVMAHVLLAIVLMNLIALAGAPTT